MPTFERCSSCVAKGVPSDEAPIVPEGKACVGCHAEQIASMCRDHDYLPVCDGCGEREGDTRYRFSSDRVWRCHMCEEGWSPDAAK